MSGKHTETKRTTVTTVREITVPSERVAEILRGHFEAPDAEVNFKCTDWSDDPILIEVVISTKTVELSDHV